MSFKWKLVYVVFLGPLVSLIAFNLVNGIWAVGFPEHYVRTFEPAGKIERLELAPDGSIVVLEKVTDATGRTLSQRRGGSYVVSRFRVLDPATGKTTAGAWVLRSVKWLGIRGDSVLCVGTDDGIFEARSIKTGDVVLSMTQLEAMSPEVAGHLNPKAAQFEANEDGLLGFRTDQALDFFVDVTTGVIQRGRLPSVPRRKHGGKPELDKTAMHYVLPDWTRDTGTGEIVDTGAGWVAQHYERLESASQGNGLMLSLIDAQGGESWRYQTHRDVKAEPVRLFSGVLAVVQQTRVDGWVLHGLDPATGAERWSAQ